MLIVRTNRLKINDIKSKTKAKDHRASFGRVPMTVFPIPAVKIEVRVADGEIRLVGITAAFPITICTARASPKARAIPKITAVKIPGKAARRITRCMVCHIVAPRAKEALR